MAFRCLISLLRTNHSLAETKFPTESGSLLQHFVSTSRDDFSREASSEHAQFHLTRQVRDGGGAALASATNGVVWATGSQGTLSSSLGNYPGNQSYQHSAYRSLSTDSHDDLAEEGEKPPEKGGKGSAGDETGLPLIQRCKNVLVSNWRGQLSSIYPGAAEGERNSVRTSLVRYAMLDGRPLIWLPRHDEHETNIIADNRASLMAGHTDPAALVQMVQKGCKRLPPLAVILGEVSEVEPSEAEYWRKRVWKLFARALSAIERAGPKARALLDTVGPTIEARQKAFEEMAEASELRAYRLEPKEWTYMDVAGDRKSGTTEELEGSLTDPLANVSIPLIDALNRNQTARKRLVLFSAAYMQVEARDAYIISLDRWGFTCLVQRGLSVNPAEIGTPVTLKTGSMGKSEGEWGEFRFSFAHEVRDAEGFCAMLEAMEGDVIKHYKEQTEASSQNASS